MNDSMCGPLNLQHLMYHGAPVQALLSSKGEARRRLFWHCLACCRQATLGGDRCERAVVGANQKKKKLHSFSQLTSNDFHFYQFHGFLGSFENFLARHTNTTVAVKQLDKARPDVRVGRNTQTSERQRGSVADPSLDSLSLYWIIITSSLMIN